MDLPLGVAGLAVMKDRVVVTSGCAIVEHMTCNGSSRIMHQALLSIKTFGWQPVLAEPDALCHMFLSVLSFPTAYSLCCSKWGSASDWQSVWAAVAAIVPPQLVIECRRRL